MESISKLLEKAKEAKSAEELFQLAKDEGYECTMEEAKKLFEKLSSGDGELDPEDLGEFAGGRKCFITTAVCEYLDKPDDCEELTKLRAFRDNYMESTAEGRRLVALYYEIAPAIVKALAVSRQKDLIYKMLWSRYIRCCIELMDAGKNAECQELYSEMVNLLLEAFPQAASKIA